MTAQDAVAELTALTASDLTQRRRQTVSRCCSIARAHKLELKKAAHRIARRAIGSYWREDQHRCVPSALHVTAFEIARDRARTQASQGTDYRSGRHGELIPSDALVVLEWAGRRRCTARMAAFRTTAQLQKRALVQRRAEDEKPWDPSFQIHQLLRPRLRDDRLRVLNARLTRSEAMELVAFALEGLSERIPDHHVSSALGGQESRALARRRPAADNEMMGHLYGRTLRELFLWMGTYDFSRTRCNDANEKEALRADRLSHSGEIDARLIYTAEAACTFVESAAGFDAPIDPTKAGPLPEDARELLEALLKAGAIGQDARVQLKEVAADVPRATSRTGLSRALGELKDRDLAMSQRGHDGGTWIPDEMRARSALT